MPSLDPTDPAAFYGPAQRSLQAEFGSTDLADVHVAGIVRPTLSEEQQAFVASRDFFFLSTVDADGWPTVSYKGGAVGFVRVDDEASLRFPLYDGNGMWVSAGNVAETARIGLLFIDFERPDRLRVHATAQVDRSAPALEEFPGAQLVVRVTVDNVFVNCARYIHRHQRTAASEYVPSGDGSQPHPSWKRIDRIQPFLNESDRARTADSGGEITAEEYARRLADGTS